MTYCIKEITEKQVWDLLVVKYAPQAYFQSWDWGEIERCSGKRVWRLAIMQNQKSKIKSQNIAGVSQIIKVEAKRSTFLHVRNGPVFLEWNKKTFLVWLNYVKKLARLEKVAFIRISPLVDRANSIFFHEFAFRKASIHKMDGEIVSVVNVDKPEEELLASMRKNTRYSIRKGIKEQVTVRKSNDIDLFLALHKKTYERHEFVPHQAIVQEFNQMSKSGNAELLFAYHNNTALAGAIVCYFGNQAIYRHGGSIQTKIPAAYVLQWEIMKRVAKRGIPNYNLYGIADSKKPKKP